MEIIKDNIHHSASRDSYWSRVHLKSSSNKETLLFVCASHEYLGNFLKTRELNDNTLRVWLEEVVTEWQLKGESIFKKPVHLEVKAITEYGYKNGLEFLEKEIIPSL
jgi:hypothetical protein